VEAGIVSGYPDGTFRPQDTITRQEAAVVLFRLLAPGAGDAGTYKDSGVISDWAEGAVKAISAAGIMSGYPDGTFRPQNSITRAETIVTLERGLALKVAELIIDEPGTYGPETDKQTIKGNVIISSKDVILQNTVITGDLVLEGKIGEGDVTLKKVQVGGETIIKGGGSESITLEDCILPKVTVSKNGVRVEATGSTMVSVIRLDSGAILVSVTDTGTGFESVIVSEAVPPEARIVFSGYFENITVDGSDTEIEVEKGSTVENLTLNAPAIVTGEGSITTANINANGVEIEQKPQKTNVAKGITATVAGKKVSDDEQVSVSTGGYTTPSTPSKKVSVSAISVTTDKTEYKVGEELDLSSLVLTVEYDNNTSEVINVTMDMVSGFDSSKPGTLEVTVTYKGKIATFTVNIVEEGPVVVTGELVGSENYPGYENWKDAITSEGIDFSKITKAQAIKMGINDPDYYGIALDLKVNGEVVELNTANLSKVERVKPNGEIETPIVTAEGTVQFVHDGWGETGEYTMRYTLTDGTVVEAKINVVSFDFAPEGPVVVTGELVGSENYPGYENWKDAITSEGIDFSKITKAQAIKMGINDPDYYGIALDLKVNGEVVELNTANLSKVERVKPNGEIETPIVTAEGTVQFVHDGWGGPGEYTMRYTLNDGRVIEAKINVVSFEFKPVVLDGELVPATDYPGYDSWKDAITEEGIDFSKITQAQAIKMGIADPDYYGIAMYLKVGDDTIELNSDKLESVVRIDPEGNEVEPQVTADNIYQFVHDGWGGPGEYTMRYTLNDGRVIEAKINVVSFEFKPVVLDGELVPATDYPGYDSWKDAITEEGIDFSKITQAQAIKMGIADPDYYGIAMYLKVGDDTIELYSDKLESVVRIDPEGNEVEPQVTADNIYQFVHDGWGGPGEYTMRYTLNDGRVIEAKINVVSFEFKPVVLDGELVAAEDYTSYENWEDAITEDGIDFSQITKDQAIAMGLPGVDYYGVAMYLEVDGEQVDLSC
jgi:uncharacterized protein YnzC (UPF0291/DUF896 family)